MKKLDRKKIYIYQNDVPKSYEARQQFTDEVTKRGYTIVDSYDQYGASGILPGNSAGGYFRLPGFLRETGIHPAEYLAHRCNHRHGERNLSASGCERNRHSRSSHPPHPPGHRNRRFPGTGILRRRVAGFHFHGIHRLQLCFGRRHHSSATGCAADHPNRTVQHQCLPMLSFQHPLSGQHDHAYDAD